MQLIEGGEQQVHVCQEDVADTKKESKPGGLVCGHCAIF
jgi:hypothetical protein